VTPTSGQLPIPAGHDLPGSAFAGDRQRGCWRGYRDYADRVIAPAARAIDGERRMPRELMRDLGRSGWLSALLPAEWGGAGIGALGYGMMAEELGRTCQNARNFVAVQDMVSDAIWRWGTDEQRRRWLSAIASGEQVAAFLLTEPDIGSDAAHVATRIEDSGADLVLTGVKTWISFGQCADVFLVFGQYRGQHTAVLVQGDTPGITVEPCPEMLGLRGSMLARIAFAGCRVSRDALVGRPGSGMVFVASAALDIGRYSTAWGSVGLAHACLEESAAYALRRVQSGKPIAEHELVQHMLADMITESRAARLLCWQAGEAMQREDEDATYQTLMAKYFASTAAARIASQAVQLQGANGMVGESIVARLFRDSKALEVIEGTTQVIQHLLGRGAGSVMHPGYGIVASRDAP
jgi:glutaryl-CoA dehydrogenase (non-decarboxylating)